MPFIEREIDTLMRIKHENIANLIEYGTGIHDSLENFQYIIIELADGGSLCDLLTQIGRLEEEYARYYFKQLLEVLRYLHAAGYSHRDIKPSNLLLD